MTQERMTGAAMIIKALVEQDVDSVFGYPGGAVLPIYDEIFKQNQVRHFLARQEGGAVHAAEGYARSTGKVGVVLPIEGRDIVTRRCGDGVAWFEFAALCDGPRSQNDYIELAMLFQTVLVGNVPRFDEKKEDQARRFISLVDEFYDRNVKLIISAETSILDLYQGQRLAFEFQRTESRLQEMQSKEYLAQEHKP